MTPCSIDGCPNQAKRAGLCWTHMKRRQRRVSLEMPIQEKRPPWRAVVNAAIDINNADTADDKAFHRALKKLWMAIDRAWKRRAETGRRT